MILSGARRFEICSLHFSIFNTAKNEDQTHASAGGIDYAKK
jgi:hypothetical protein